MLPFRFKKSLNGHRRVGTTLNCSLVEDFGFLIISEITKDMKKSYKSKLKKRKDNIRYRM